MLLSASANFRILMYNRKNLEKKIEKEIMKTLLSLPYYKEQGGFDEDNEGNNGAEVQ